MERLRAAAHTHGRTGRRRRPATADRPGAPPADGSGRGADHDDGRYDRRLPSRKRDALRAHASQLAESWFAKMPESLFDEVFGVESFIREQDRTAAPIPEIDLFAGLR